MTDIEIQAQMTKDQADMEAKAQADANQNVKNNYYKNTLGSALGLGGNVAGIIIAVKRKSGFWGGAGWFLLIGAAGAAAGYLVGSLLDGKPKDQ